MKRVVELSVAYVGHGGNTNQGEYFYSFNPANILVHEPDVEIEYQLSKATAANFEIYSVVTSDTANQISNFRRSTDRRSGSVMNANTVEVLISVSVLVTDNNRDGVIVNCDPQMTNIPRRPS